MRRLESTLALMGVLGMLSLATPSRADEAGTILSFGPVAFYQFNETNNPSGSPAAMDSAGANNGTYLPNCQNAYNGITGPGFEGFAGGNAAVKTTYNTANAYVGLPALPISGNTVTILAWVNPNASSQSNKSAGIAFNTRDTSGGSSGSASNACGFGFAQSGTPQNGTYPLYGLWRNNGGNWNSSGVYVPTNQWSMVAAVFSPTNITVYLMSTNGSQSGTLTQSNAPATWNLAGTPYANYIGRDPYTSAGDRTFDGRIDDVAFFNYCLSSNQLATVFSGAFSNVTVAPFIAIQPSPATNYQGTTATFTVAADASTPVSYQWQRGGTNLVDHGNVSGSTNATLTLSNLALADAAADYCVVVTNSDGAVTSSIAALTVIPSSRIANKVLALGALAFWEFNETNDPASGGVVAFDYVGHYNGIYQTNAQNGNAKYNIAGPRPPGSAGFTSTNTGLRTVYNAAYSFVGLPGISYAGNTATMVAWINPSAFHAESGILFSTRDGSGSLTGGNGTNSCGLGFSGVAKSNSVYCSLMALWGNNGWNWSSGVFVPSNQWSMVAGVVTPTSITVYMVNTNGIQSGSANYANPACSWLVGGTNYIGMDPYDGAAGSFDGKIDDVAFFGYSLSAAQILELYQAGAPTIQITSQPVSLTVDPHQTARFTVAASTSGSLYYQWFAGMPGGAYAPLTDGGDISGCATATLTISNASVGDCLNYYVQMSTADGAVVNSSVVSLSLTSWERPGQGGVVNAVAASRDGTWIASGSDDNTIKLWRASDGSLARTLAIGGLVRVTALAFSADSATLAAGYVDGTIRLWNPASGALNRTMNLVWRNSTLTNNLGKIASLAFSPDGQWLAAVGGDLYTRFWKVADGTMNQAGVRNGGPVGSVAWSPDGTKLATGSEDRRVTLISTNNNWATTAVLTLGSNVTAVAFSPDGSVLAAGCLDGTVTFWQSSNMTQSNSFMGTGAGITSLTFGTNAQILFSGDESGFIARWSSSSGWNTASQISWPGHTNGTGGVRSLAVTTDNNRLVSGGADYQVSLWQASSGAALGNLSSHAGMITRTSFSPDGSMVASASHDGSVRLWAAISGLPLAVLAVHTNQVSAMAFSPDSTLLVSGGGCLDNTLRIFSCSNLALLQTIVAATNGVTTLAVSPDSSLVASAGDRPEQVIRLWRVSDSSQVWQAAGHTDGTGVLAFSPDGQYLASGGLFNDGTIRLWNANDGSPVRTLSAPAITDRFLTFNTNDYSGARTYVTNTVVHTCSIQALAFNSTSTLLASAGARDGVVNVWQIDTGTLLTSLTNLALGARSVAFSPDGTLLAAAGSDAILMWRTSDWQPVWTYTTETVGISSLGFSPNGTFLVFGRDDGTVDRIWNPLANPINLTLGVAPAGRITIVNPFSPFLSIWASSSLANPPSWSLLTNVVASTNLIQVTDPSPALPPTRFYRVTTPP
jgi:WD40 repeat protein